MLHSLMTLQVEGLQSAFQSLEPGIPCKWLRQWELLMPCKELRVDVDLILVYSQSFANEKALRLGASMTCVARPRNATWPGRRASFSGQARSSDVQVGRSRVVPEQCLLGQVLPQHVLHLSESAPQWILKET